MDVQEILEPTRKYEKINLLKGFAGLYYRFSRNLSLAMFGLLILVAVSTDEIYYDKGIAQFTLFQIGQIVVILSILFDILFHLLRLLMDQQYTDFLSTNNRNATIKKYIIISLLLSILIAISMILLASQDILDETIAWMIESVMIGLILVFIGKKHSHMPTLLAGGLITVAGFLLSFLSAPYWAGIFMVYMAAGYIAATFGYYQAELEV